jgi:hypothetical protein
VGRLSEGVAVLVRRSQDDATLRLGLTPEQKRDLVEYLKSL